MKIFVAILVAGFLSVSLADPSPAPDCPPEGHAFSSYSYPSPQVQLSVDKYESVSVAPTVTYAKTAQVLYADKSPSASYAAVVPSGISTHGLSGILAAPAISKVAVTPIPEVSYVTAAPPAYKTVSSAYLPPVAAAPVFAKASYAAPAVSYAAPAIAKVGYAGYGYASPAIAKVGYSDASLVSGSYVSAPAVAKTISYGSPVVSYGGPSVAKVAYGYGAPSYAKVGYSDASLVSNSYVSSPVAAKTISYAAPAVSYAAPAVAKVGYAGYGYAAPSVSKVSYGYGSPAYAKVGYSDASLVSNSYISSPVAAKSISYAAPAVSYAAPAIAKVGYAGYGYAAPASYASYGGPSVAKVSYGYGAPSVAKVGYSDASLVSSSYVSSPVAAKTISYAAPAVSYAASPVAKVGYSGYGYAAPAVSYGGPSLSKVAYGYGAPAYAKAGYSDASLVSSSYVSSPVAAKTISYAAPAVSYSAPAVAKVGYAGYGYAAPAVAKVGYSDASLVSSSYVSAPAIAKTISYGAPAVSYGAPAVSYGAPGFAKVASYSSAPLVSSAYVSSPAIAKVNGLAYGAGYGSGYGKVLATPNYAAYSPLAYSGAGYAKVAAAPVISSTAYGHGAEYGAYGSGFRYASAVSPISTYSAVPATVVKPLAHVVSKPIIDKQYEYYNDHPRYAFEYGVNDPHTGDIKHQKEERDGDVVRGEYSLVEPDGNVRTVKYYADWETGFHAEVINSRDQVHGAKVIAKRKA